LGNPNVIKPDYVNSYDFDGVITVGLIPRAQDIIITGRGVDEEELVRSVCNRLGIVDPVICLNAKTKKMGRTREDSGEHKAKVILSLIKKGVKLWNHFEDDPLQISTILDIIEERKKQLNSNESLSEDEKTELEILKEFHIVPVLTYRQDK
jgi:hypothetical protein